MSEKQPHARIKPRIIIHGGAGNLARAAVPLECYRAFREALLRIVRAPHRRAGSADARNPVLLAKAVLERGDADLVAAADLDVLSAQGHSLLWGAAAEQLARAYGLALVDPEYFFTQRRWDEHLRELLANCLPWRGPGASCSAAPATGGAGRARARAASSASKASSSATRSTAALYAPRASCSWTGTAAACCAPGSTTAAPS